MEKGTLTLMDNNGDEIQFYSETSADMVKHNHAGTETTVAALLNSVLAGDIDIEALNEKQDKSDILTGLSNLTLSADKLILATGENSFSTTALTSTGKNIISSYSDKEIRKALGVYKNLIYDECENVWGFLGSPEVSGGKLILDGGSNFAWCNKTLDLDGTTPFTIECYANSIQNSSLSYISPVLVLEPTNSTSHVICVRIDGASSAEDFGFYRFEVYGDGAHAVKHDTTTSQWNVEKHIAISFDGTKFYCFVGGEKIGETEFNNFSGTYNLKLGRYSATATRFWNGTLDEVRISDTCRYTQNFTPETRFEVDEHTLSLLHFD